MPVAALPGDQPNVSSPHDNSVISTDDASEIATNAPVEINKPGADGVLSTESIAAAKITTKNNA